MVDVNDLGPTSSYSDPFYDRLDSIFRFIKGAWPLVLLAILLVVAAVFALTWMLQRHPAAGSAVRYIAARDTEDEAKRLAALTTVAADTSVTPVFRTLAQNDLVQAQLLKGDTAGAAPLAAKASEYAAQGDDFAVQLIAKLTRAGTYQQAKELDQAATAYAEVKRAAGAKHPMEQLEATLGLARTLVLQGKSDDAIVELEALINRNDAGAEQLLGFARLLYWDLKRTQAEAKLAPAAAPVAPVAAPVAPAPEAAPAPAAVVVPAPAAAAPAAPVAPLPAAIPQPK